MNKNSINKLLSKEGWTGKEVGQALFASLMYDMGKPVRGVEGVRDTLFSEEDFRRMEKSLEKDPHQQKVYFSYTSMYSGMVQALNFAQGQVQQFFHGYYRNFDSLHETIGAEQSIMKLCNQPIIMTRQQYDRLKGKIEQEKKKQDIVFNVVVRDIVDYYLDHKDEEAPAGIREALEALKDKPCTNQRIIDNHNIDNDIGEIRDADGNITELYDTSNENIADVEYTESKAYKRAIFVSELCYKGIDALKKQYKEDNLTDEEAQRILDYLKDEEKRDEIELTEKEEAVIFQKILGVKKNKDAHFIFDDPPKDLNKYDALYYDIARYFNCYLYRWDAKTDTDLDEISEAEQFDEFKKDYADLYKAVLTYIKKLYPKKAVACDKDPFSVLGSWEELGSKGVAPYTDENSEASEEEIIEEYLKEDGNSYLPLKESKNRSIAVIENPHSDQIDAEGNYKQEQLSIITNHTLEYLADKVEKEDEQNPEYIKELLIAPALQAVYSFLAVTEMIEEIYGIKGLLDFTKEYIGAKEIEQNIPVYNALIYLLNRMFYGSGKTLERKRELLKSTFTPINKEDYQPAEEDLELVREAIKTKRSKAERLNSTFLLLNYIERLCGKGVAI